MPNAILWGISNAMICRIRMGRPPNCPSVCHFKRASLIRASYITCMPSLWQCLPRSTDQKLVFEHYISVSFPVQILQNCTNIVYCIAIYINIYVNWMACVSSEKAVLPLFRLAPCKLRGAHWPKAGWRWNVEETCQLMVVEAKVQQEKFSTHNSRKSICSQKRHSPLHSSKGHHRWERLRSWSASQGSNALSINPVAVKRPDEEKVCMQLWPFQDILLTNLSSQKVLQLPVCTLPA